jgi:hypothetical protein
VWRSNIQEAESIDVLRPARQLEDPQVLAPALIVTALIDLKRGRRGSAISLVSQFEEATRTTAWVRGLRVLDAIRICQALGISDLAETLLRGLTADSPRMRATRTAAQAYLAEFSGALEEAVVHFQDAAVRWGEFGYPLEEAFALLGSSRCLAQLKREEESSHKLKDARSILEELSVDDPALLEGEFSRP